MASTNTSYGPGGGVTTQATRSQLTLPDIPDFWNDLGKIKGQLKASDQASALRRPASYMTEGPAPVRNAGQLAYNPYEGKTGRSYGTPSMSPQGVMGTYVNPLDVPLELRGSVPTGFYADNAASNYTYSPTVDPGRYGQSSSGGGGRR